MNSNRMFSIIRSVAIVAATITLAGCAAGSAGMTTKSGRGYAIDADYVVAVNRQAKRKGVNVVWVNPPQELGKEYLARSE